jgi:hypothetical protein
MFKVGADRLLDGANPARDPPRPRAGDIAQDRPAR